MQILKKILIQYNFESNNSKQMSRMIAVLSSQHEFGLTYNLRGSYN